MCRVVVPQQWAALPSGMDPWVLEGSENCLKGKRERDTGGPRGAFYPGEV